MHWRRGFLLAAIHLAVAGAILVSLQARDAAFRKAYLAAHVKPPESAAKPATSPAEEGAVTFDLCQDGGHYPAGEDVVRSANIPSFALTGWRIECPAPWTLSGTLHLEPLFGLSAASIAAQREIDLGFLVLIAIQWVLVGGLPLQPLKSGWREPAMFITICTVLAAALLPIPPLSDFARFPALFAIVAWIWWLGLLAWKAGRAVWKFATRRAASSSIA